MQFAAPLGALAAAAVVLTLVGCSSPAGGGELTYEDSPLNAYLASAWGGDLSPEEQEKKFAQMQRDTEELVAKCMSKEGFEYEPVVHDTSAVFSDDEDWDPDSKEWVQKYGYGMVNNPFAMAMAAQPGEAGEGDLDPNQAYVETLSPSEQTAYYETLHGPAMTEEQANEDGSFEYDWKTAGCYGAAQHEVNGEDVWANEDFAALTEKMQELWTNMPNAAGMKELDAKWAACMTDAGQPGFTTQSEPAMSFNDELNRIYEAAYGDGSAEFDPSTFVDPKDTPEMKELGEREVELALIDLECREKTAYRAESLKIQFDLEEKFIAANKAELEAFKAAAEQSK